MMLTAQSEVGSLRRVLLKTPSAAFQNDAAVVASLIEIGDAGLQPDGR